MADSPILDRFGRPIQRQALTREVAAPTLTGVRSLWGFESVSSGLTPSRLAALLLNAIEGDHRDYLSLAEEMEERDLHYASVLGTRKLAVAGLPVVVEAATDDARDVELADAVRELVRAPDFGEMLSETLDALGKGYSAIEIIWDRSGSQWRPARYEWRDPRFFMFDRITGRELRLLDLSLEGEPLPPYKFIVHRPRFKTGLPIRGGLARMAAVAYMCKAYTIKDWMAFAEVFGMPLRLGRYGQGASDKDVQTLITAVANIGSDAAAVLPDTMRIDFQEAGKSTGGDELFLKLAEWWDKQISKGILGQTMTADDGASLSQAKVHNEVRGDILQADAKQLSNTLNRDLVRPFIDLNYGPQKNYPRLELQIIEPEDIVALADALAKLVPLGNLGIEASVVRDRLGFPDPAEGAVLLGTTPATPPAENSRHAQSCPHCAKASNRQGPAPDAIDALADEALADWDLQMTPILDPVRQLAESAASYEEFIAGLPALLDQMDSRELVQRLATAAFKARGLGDATDEP